MGALAAADHVLTVAEVQVAVEERLGKPVSRDSVRSRSQVAIRYVRAMLMTAIGGPEVFSSSSSARLRSLERMMFRVRLRAAGINLVGYIRTRRRAVG